MALGSWRLALAAAAAACVVGVGAQPALAQSSRAQQDRHRKFDNDLRQKLERVESGQDPDAPVKVIVTLKPHARRGLGQKVRGRGGRHGGDFSVINGGAAELPPSKLRELAVDDDVLNISVDADVHPDGVASSLTGTAQGGGFSLRSALGLRAPSAFTTTTSFQRGNASGYASVVDTGVDLAAPATAYGAATSVYVEGFGSTPAGMLVRFDNIFGTGPGQIPPGSTITSASLRIAQLQAGSSSTTMSLYKVLVPWDANSTWNSMATSGAGLQFNNVEVASAPDASVTNLALTGQKTFSGAALTATVQGWANGQPNQGWVVFLNTATFVRTATSEDSFSANRPLLSVTYKAPVNTTTLTGNGVTVAVIDSGLLEDGGTTSRIKTTRDFTTGLTNPAHVAPVDGYGHGTHIAGLIGGNKSEVEGVAPGVKFVSLKVLNSLGVGSTSHVINAIQWAIANKAAYGIDILNLSLGHPVLEPSATDPLVQAVEAASRAGITSSWRPATWA